MKGGVFWQVSKDAVLGEVGQGYKYAIGMLNGGRIGIGAQVSDGDCGGESCYGGCGGGGLGHFTVVVVVMMVVEVAGFVAVILVLVDVEIIVVVAFVVVVVILMMVVVVVLMVWVVMYQGTVSINY